MFKLIGFFAALLGTTALDTGTAPPTDSANEAARMAALDPTLAGRKACRGFDAYGQALDARLELAASLPLMSQASQDMFPLYSNISQSDIGVTALDGEARRYFDQGVALLYGFNHAAAVRSFRKARAYDQNCAMCWWGEAYANGLNINAGMSEEQNRQAIFAVQRAQQLSDGLSEVEKALIAAQAARFPDDLDADRAALEKTYSAMMMSIAERFPESNDIAVLAAESAMNTTPWDYWDPDTREARPQIGPAIALIERVMENNPRHPQASHLYIHLMENGPDPKMAEAAADRLVDSAPSALGHLVHMPGHIYYRIGRYTDSITANIKAARADEEYLRVAGDDGLYRFGYYPHNVHFLLTSAQMAGDMLTVTNETERLRMILNEDIAKQLPWVQAIHAAPSFALTQYASPNATLALTSKAKDLAYVEAMRNYARAVAFARSGDDAGFDEAIAAMLEVKDHEQMTYMVENGFPAPDIVDLAVHVAQGRKSHADGDYDAAVMHYEAAQAIEKTIPYNEPPYWYYPVAQSLGAAHFKAGRYKEAQAAFREALFKAPNNGWALYGLSMAEKKLGNDLEAKAAKEAMARSWIGDNAWLSMDRL